MGIRVLKHEIQALVGVSSARMRRGGVARDQKAREAGRVLALNPVRKGGLETAWH